MLPLIRLSLWNLSLVFNILLSFVGALTTPPSTDNCSQGSHAIEHYRLHLGAVWKSLFRAYLLVYTLMYLFGRTFNKSLCSPISCLDKLTDGITRSLCAHSPCSTSATTISSVYFISFVYFILGSQCPLHLIQLHDSELHFQHSFLKPLFCTSFSFCNLYSLYNTSQV